MLVSWRDNWFPADQLPLLQLVRASGVEIRGHRAARLHAKWLLADSTLILGSCDFTEASQQHLERGVRLELDGGLREEQEAEFDDLFRTGERFTEEVSTSGRLES